MRVREREVQTQNVEDGGKVSSLSPEPSSKSSMSSASGSLPCRIFGLILFILLGVSLLGAYKMHLLHEGNSGVDSSVHRHRKFSGDYANVARDDVSAGGSGVEEDAKPATSATIKLLEHLKSKRKEKREKSWSSKSASSVQKDTHETHHNVAVTSVESAGASLKVDGSRGQCRSSISREWHGKHTVEPPEGPMTLVCCQTTKGPLNIAVHTNWAPLGAANFLSMVTEGFFSSKVPLFRALKGFIIQFGLSSDPKVQKSFEKSHLHGRGGLPDDPQWLPAGPPGRKNEQGIKRFQQGYLAYAGSGKNSRGTQLIVALQDNEYLGGGSPWEVPWGKLFGEESYETLRSIYTGYGEHVSQGKIRNRGMEYLQSEAPLVDYINSCEVIVENVQYT